MFYCYVFFMSLHQEIVTLIDDQLQKYEDTFKAQTELHDIDAIELSVSLRFMLYSVVFKINHEDCKWFFFSAEGTVRQIFRYALLLKTDTCIS